MRKCLLLLFILLSIQYPYAQRLWTTAGLKYDILKNLSAGLEGEYRSRNKFKGIERWSIGLGVDYKIIPYLKLDAGYKFIQHHEAERVTSKGNIVESFWQPRQRAYFSLTGIYKVNRFTFSLRERYQYTHHKGMYIKKTSGTGKPKEDEYIEGKDKNILRSKIKIDYSIRKTGFTPFLSGEIYNNLTNFGYVKTRLTIGSEFKINKHNAIEAFYRYIDKKEKEEQGGSVIGIGYQFKF